MCFLLYVGSNSPLPRKAWRVDAPDVNVRALVDEEMPIKAHFTAREVQYVGSTSDCGCDFPHAMFQNGGWPEIEFADSLESYPDRIASERYNRGALVNLLRGAGEEAVELYGVWAGDYAKPPESREVIKLERIVHSDFIFKERGFYKVIAR
jgi:hypothetical protein